MKGYIFNPYLSEHETSIVIDYAVKCGKNILEIGCNAGLTSCALAGELPDRVIYAVDYTRGTNPHQEYEMNGLFSKCQGVKNIVCKDENAHNLIIPKEWDIGMVFIDGDHTYGGVKADFENVRRQIDPVFILMHDYDKEDRFEWNGVHRYVDEIRKENDVVFFEGSSLVLIKKGGTK